MQGSIRKNPVKFILISESVSFIPDNILGCCEVVNIPRPTKSAYSACIGKRLGSNIDLSKLENIKNLKDPFDVIDTYDIICDKIVDDIHAEVISNWSEFRDHIYDIFTYNLDVHKCVWRIMFRIMTTNAINDATPILDKTYSVLKLFNNNYRPIYHLEAYFLFLKLELRKIKGNK